jgi:tripartite-type tricarboxylate transporter receptor subunit TctC
MRRLLASLLTLIALASGTLPAQAQSIGSGQPISLFVGFAAGGPADVLARIIAERPAGDRAEPSGCRRDHRCGRGSPCGA